MAKNKNKANNKTFWHMIKDNPKDSNLCPLCDQKLAGCHIGVYCSSEGCGYVDGFAWLTKEEIEKHRDKIVTDLGKYPEIDKNSHVYNITKSQDVEPGLFQKTDIILHSGAKSDFKIECDVLTNQDIEGLAHIIFKKYKYFHRVCGVPRGGLRLANALQKYITHDRGCVGTLVVDDVLTTGNSMNEFRDKMPDKSWAIGVVIFARGKCPEWVTPIFQMWE